MDPLTALSLAAAVVQFADFGVRLLSKTTRLYKSASGAGRSTVELQVISSDLKELIDNVEQKSVPLAHLGGHVDASNRRLLGICARCKEACANLDDAIMALESRGLTNFNFDYFSTDSGGGDSGGQWRENFATSLKRLWRGDKIENLGKRLSDIRQSLMEAFLESLWEESKAGSKDIHQLSEQQVGMISTLSRIDENTKTLNQTLMQLVHHSKSESTNRDATSSFWSSDYQPAEIGSSDATNILGLDQGENMVDNPAFCTTAIIESLTFEDADHREQGISKSFETTFEWAFGEPPRLDTGDPMWSDLRSWLSSQHADVYWITGKPGSGKSTLMKFLVSHPRTRSYLKEWAGSKPHLMASFYFWNPGSHLQKSQEGLLRNLLRQCLEQKPKLAPKIFPRRWALLKLFGRQALKAIPPWTWEELLEAFSALDIMAGRDRDFNLAIFIDGVDEFDGKHDRLIDLIKLLHSRPSIKVCVSSRPWNIFEDAFRCNPSLRLEDLTRNDISKFISGNLEKNQAYRDLHNAFPAGASQIQRAVLEKAQGVFLWVSVVVRAILEGLTEGDKLSDIQGMVDELPSDLSKMYTQIWRRIKSDYLRHGSQLFRIYECSTSQVDAITLWLADEEDPFEIDIQSITPAYRAHIVQSMKRRLNSRTRGLLEVSYEGNVSYLHRSVKEWIQPRWGDIQLSSESWLTFDPNLALLKAKAVKAPDTSYWATRCNEFSPSFWEFVEECFGYASQVGGCEQNLAVLVRSLDLLDRNLTKVAMTDTLGIAMSLPTLYSDAGTNPGRPQDLPHWATCQWKICGHKTHSPPLTNKEVDFIYLSAQFSILPYVSAKVTENPAILNISTEKSPLLAGTIFGFRSKGPDLQTRYELAQILIEQHFKIVDLDDYSRQTLREIYKVVKGRAARCPETWEAIAKLFEDRGLDKPTNCWAQIAGSRPKGNSKWSRFLKGFIN